MTTPEQREELRRLLAEARVGKLLVIDEGGPPIIQDDCFSHDACLNLSGDFVDDQANKYANAIASVVNNAHALLDDADERDRLKEGWESMNEYAGQAHQAEVDALAERDALKAEVERLREALMLLELCAGKRPQFKSDDIYDYDWVRAQARAALTAESPALPPPSRPAQ